MARLKAQEETIKELNIRLAAVESEHSKQIAAVIQTINEFKFQVIQQLTRLETQIAEIRK